MSAIISVEPRTGAVTDTGLTETSVPELSEIAKRVKDQPGKLRAKV